MNRTSDDQKIAIATRTLALLSLLSVAAIFLILYAEFRSPKTSLPRSSATTPRSSSVTPSKGSTRRTMSAAT